MPQKPHPLLALLLLLLLLPACATNTAARRPASASAVVPTGLPAGVAPLPPDLAERLQELTEAAEQARGLSAKHPVRAGLLDRETLQRQVAGILRDELPPAELAAIEEALQAFGFVPEDLDLARYLPELLAGEVAGYYDPEKKYLAIVRQPAAGRADRGGRAGRADPGRRPAKGENAERDLDEPSAFERRTEDTVIIHELVHALQDQHFGLDRFKGDEDPLSDAAAARDALVEGDATVAMFGFLLGIRIEDDPEAAEGVLRSLGAAGQAAAALGSEGLAEAPVWLRESLLFSYVEGAAFCLDLLKTGGHELLDHAYKAPPLSTEQILHPEKWHGRRRDDPVRLAWPDLGATLPGYRKLIEGELGERDVRLLLRESLRDGDAEQDKERRRAEAAAAGWGGDRFAVYTKGRTRLLVWITEWDAAAEAGEFAAAAARLGRGWSVERLSPTRVGLVREMRGKAGRQLPALWRALAGASAARPANQPLDQGLKRLSARPPRKD
jgi:hypothetical protein